MRNELGAGAGLVVRQHDRDSFDSICHQWSMILKARNTRYWVSLRNSGPPSQAARTSQKRTSLPGKVHCLKSEPASSGSAAFHNPPVPQFPPSLIKDSRPRIPLLLLRPICAKSAVGGARSFVAKLVPARMLIRWEKKVCYCLVCMGLNSAISLGRLRPCAI